MRRQRDYSSIRAYAVLFLTVTCTFHLGQAQQTWPYNLPPDTNHFQEDKAPEQQEADIAARLSNMMPSAVRKMSGDPAEMFFLEYYGFDDVQGDINPSTEDADTSGSWTSRWSLHAAYEPPTLVHSNLSSHLTPRGVAWTLYERAFQCPSGTSSCADIGRPNSCCAHGLTCDIVTDTGLGDVGCCTTGSSCAGEVTACPSGYSTCSDKQGGGCCIPGYACDGTGCMILWIGFETHTADSSCRRADFHNDRQYQANSHCWTDFDDVKGGCSCADNLILAASVLLDRLPQLSGVSGRWLLPH